MSSARRLTAALVTLASAGVLCTAGDVFPVTPAGAAAPAGFSVHDVATGFSVPTGFAYAPDGRIFVTEKDGVVKIIDPDGTKRTWLDISSQVNHYGDRGLNGIALDPNFSSNRRVFLLFTQELDPSNPDSSEP